MKLSWITLAAVALGLGALALGALVPAVTTAASLAGSFLLGVAIPHGTNAPTP